MSKKYVPPHLRSKTYEDAPHKREREKTRTIVKSCDLGSRVGMGSDGGFRDMIVKGATPLELEDYAQYLLDLKVFTKEIYDKLALEFHFPSKTT